MNGRFLVALASAFLVWVLMAPAPVGAQALGIAAVVNDGVVTDSDVEQRLRLALLITGQQPTVENAARLRPQVVRALVDEQLQLQEAERLGIEIPEAAVDDEVARLAQGNDLTVDQLIGILQRAGVFEATLRQQIGSQISWSLVARRQLLPRVVVSDVQIAQSLKDAFAGAPEYRLQELFLPVYDPALEARVLEDALRLREAVAAGADFSALAQQFSAAPSAERGGEVGWIAETALPDELQTIVVQLEDGGISQPVRTREGVYLFRRLERRESGTALRVSLRRFTIPDDADDELSDFVEQARSEAQSCPALEGLAAGEPGIALSTEDDLDPRELEEPFATRALIDDVGVLSEPLRTADGTSFIMVCSRTGGAEGPQRQDIVDRLRFEALDRLATRYLRNLRQDAFIEFRTDRG